MNKEPAHESGRPLDFIRNVLTDYCLEVNAPLPEPELRAGHEHGFILPENFSVKEDIPQTFGRLMAALDSYEGEETDIDNGIGKDAAYWLWLENVNPTDPRICEILDIFGCRTDLNQSNVSSFGESSIKYPFVEGFNVMTYAWNDAKEPFDGPGNLLATVVFIEFPRKLSKIDPAMTKLLQASGKFVERFYEDQ